jgi:hypothetical protein
MSSAMAEWLVFQTMVERKWSRLPPHGTEGTEIYVLFHYITGCAASFLSKKQTQLSGDAAS